jgi:hypothetical protein
MPTFKGFGFKSKDNIKLDVWEIVRDVVGGLGSINLWIKSDSKPLWTR